MSEHNYDLVVIGGGPAGYIGAIRASQLGMKTACVEVRSTLGGTCLNVGCIPSKALLHASEVYVHTRDETAKLGVTVQGVGFDLSAMQGHKDEVVSTMTRGIDGLFKKNKVTRLLGHGRVVNGHEVAVTAEDGSVTQVTAKHILLAAGSVPIELPHAPFDEETILSSTGALALDKVPEHLVVIGGGVIGLELGSVWSRLGAKVSVIEAMPSILATMDQDVIRTMTKLAKQQGMEIYADTKFERMERHGGGVKLWCQGPKGSVELDCDKVLVAVGRRPHTKGLGLDACGVACDERGRVAVDDQFRTSVAGIYAVGDLISGPMLAHKAEEEAVACVEAIAGVPAHVNYEAIPNVVYTFPEVASVGKTEAECKQQGIAYKVGKFPFTANGRARANGQAVGFVKAIAHKDTDRLLGIHIVGDKASELIGEVALAFEYQASAEDIARSVHAHPTLTEAIKEACLGVDGRTLNM